MEKAEPDTRLATVGSIAAYTCLSGYMLPNGDIQMAICCDDVSWNITEASCISKSIVLSVNNNRLANDTKSHNKSTIYRDQASGVKCNARQLG